MREFWIYYTKNGEPCFEATEFEEFATEEDACAHAIGKCLACDFDTFKIEPTCDCNCELCGLCF